MLKRISSKTLRGLIIPLSGVISLSFIFLVIEYLDEMDYSIGGAALPSVRSDLALTYAQIGILLGLPQLINTCVEPFLMLLGDTPLRKRLVVSGGIALAIAALLIARAPAFSIILVGFILARLGSSAFVGLSQASLMDLNPGRESHMMARWSVAGSLGNLIGPLILAGAFAMALGWRPVYSGLAGIYLAMTFLVWLKSFPPHPSEGGQSPAGGLGTLRGLFSGLWETARSSGVLRWVLLEQSADLLMDVFLTYMPLYFIDIVGFTAAQAAILLSAYTLVALVESLVLIPILERFSGRAVVRLSSVVVIFMYSAFLLSPWPLVKTILVLLLPLARLGWWPILEGEAYASAPGRSGTVNAIGSLVGLVGSLFFWSVGWFASKVGLQHAMWLLLLGPISLLLWVPPHKIQASPAASKNDA